MYIDGIVQKLETIENEAQHMIARNVELQADNEHLRGLARAQQKRLNNIYEASAKAQYEAELWQKRYEAAEQFIKSRLEFTPASLPYDNMRLALRRIKRYDLHELD